MPWPSTRFEPNASLVLKHVGGNEVSASTVQRVTHQVGMELAELRDEGDAPELVQAPENPPELAVVEADGGRIRTRKPGQVRRRSWRGLARDQERQFAANDAPDVCGRPRTGTSACVHRSQASGEISGKRGSASDFGGICLAAWREGLASPASGAQSRLSSMAEASVFGQQMKREADCCCFRQCLRVPSGRRSSLELVCAGKHYFPNFVPILDFIHFAELSVRCGTGDAPGFLRCVVVLSAHGPRMLARSGDGGDGRTEALVGSARS